MGLDLTEERDLEAMLLDAECHTRRAIAGLRHIKNGLPFVQVLNSVTMAEAKLKAWRAKFSQDVTD